MKYAYTILYVESVNDTLTFYENAFGFQRKFITPEGDYGELLTGETTIAFASTGLGASNFQKGYQRLSKSEKPWGIEMAFTTEQIEEDFSKAVQHGAKIFEKVQEKPWGQKVGYLLDNNGFLIEVCTPINTN